MKRMTLVLAFLLVPALSQAGVIYGFKAITSNNAANVLAGEAQLTVEVSAYGTNQVLFSFRNAGPAVCSITDVYFDDGTLLGIASINNEPGVSFSQGGSPPNPPGHSSINFNTSAGFLADSDSPVSSNGVNPGESLGIVFNLLSGVSYDNTLAALRLSLGSPGVDVTDGLRIGIHVQAFGDGGSESFVNGPPRLVPEPGVLMLLGSGLVGLAVFNRRRVRK